MPDDGLLNWNM